MSNRIRRGLFAAAGLMSALVSPSARAEGEIEKPPGVPPEVTAAKTACPTLSGPCHGFYPTRWRVLSDCCAVPGPVVVPPERPTEIPPASRLRVGATEKAPAKPEVVPVAMPPAKVVDVPAIKPLSARSEAAPRPEPVVAAPNIVIPPPSQTTAPPLQTSAPPPISPPKFVSGASEAKRGANRPLSAEVVPETSKLRK